MRYRLPSTAAHGSTETSNREMNVPAGFCVRQTLEVEVSPSYGGEVECPKETNVDFSLFKDFEFTETWNLQFRGGGF